MNGWRRTSSKTAPHRSLLPASRQTLRLSKYYYWNSAYFFAIQNCPTSEPHSGRCVLLIARAAKVLRGKRLRMRCHIIASTLHQYTRYSLNTFDHVSVQTHPLQPWLNIWFFFKPSFFTMRRRGRNKQASAFLRVCGKISTSLLLQAQRSSRTCTYFWELAT